MSPAPDQPDRRKLRFEGVDAFMAEAERIAAGPVRMSGTWTAGQIVQHVAESIDRSIDGFDARAPLHVRLKARAAKGTVLKHGLPTGVKLPDDMRHLVPSAEVTFDVALANLRSAAARLEREKMTAAHPFFGAMSHEEWIRYHCRHAELHFGFLHPGEVTVKR